jgi:hypothetical protein
MEDHLKQILDELFALDPTLRKEEDLVRVLVLEMLNNKPNVTIDESLRQMVKARLLAQFETAKTPVRMESSLSWLWYTAPVGVTALLLLLTTPQLGNNSAPHLPVDSSYAREVSVPPRKASSPSMDNTQAKSAGVNKESRATSDAEEGLPLSDMMVPFAEETNPQNNTIFINTQKAGFALYIDSVVADDTAFIVIRDITTSEIQGITEVGSLTLGTPIKMVLDKPLLAGFVYEAALYLDTGDGIFNLDEDSLVYASSFGVDL